MPRKFEMSWDGKQHRWTKMYKGERYVVSCYALGAPTTQIGSYEQANEWWKVKRAELDGRNSPPKAGSSGAIARLLEAFAGQPLNTGEEQATAVLGLIDHYSTPGNPMPQAVRETILGREECARLQAGAEAVLDAPSAPPERAIGKLVETWVETEMRRVRAGRLGLARANMNKVCLHHFRDWLGESTPVEAIVEAKWLEWYGFLSSQVQKAVWDVQHVDRIFGVSKRFVKFLWEMRLIELPRNIDNKGLSFTVSPQVIEIFTAAELQSLWSVVSGQSKLHFLLMLNCGFIGKDINDLKQADVDWSEGTVSRKRSKTARHDDVPVVRYKLWRQTFELLKRHRSSDSEIVLFTEKGNRWITERQTAGGTYSRSDCVGRNLDYWLGRAKVKRPPKALRATAASKLGEHPAYKFYAQYFLGQSPRTVADKHYVKPSDGEFFEALAWLETALGFDEASGQTK